MIGIHTNLLTPALGDPVALSASPPTPAERAALDQLDAFHATGTGYFVEQATRPETIGYGLLDSPITLAAWMIDHDTDSYLKIARAFLDKEPSGNLTREHIVDNITLYWLTGTGASATRSYWEEGAENARVAVEGAAAVTIPVGFTSFPGEIWRSARAAGSNGPTQASCTTTRWTRAGTSRRGKSRNSSPRRCAPASAHCARRRERFASSDRNREVDDRSGALRLFTEARCLEVLRHPGTHHDACRPTRSSPASARSTARVPWPC